VAIRSLARPAASAMLPRLADRAPFRSVPTGWGVQLRSATEAPDSRSHAASRAPKAGQGLTRLRFANGGGSDSSAGFAATSEQIEGCPDATRDTASIIGVAGRSVPPKLPDQSRPARGTAQTALRPAGAPKVEAASAHRINDRCAPVIGSEAAGRDHRRCPQLAQLLT
jgi:hypothetical protein